MKNSLTTYAAFLRGINVGGNKKVPMADLKTMLEKLGCENIRTILASGNAVFQASDTDTAALTKKMEAALEATFGFPVPVILRTGEQMKKLIASDPFKNITVTPETRLYVTFLSEKSKSTLPVPYRSPDGDFRILRVTDGDVCSVLMVTKTGTTEGMKILEKEFGKKVTTRNWNTIEKLLP